VGEVVTRPRAYVSMIVPGTMSASGETYGTPNVHVIVTSATKRWDNAAGCNLQLVRTLHPGSAALGAPQLWSAEALPGQEILSPPW